MSAPELKPCPFCGGEKAMSFPPSCKIDDPYNPADTAQPFVRCMDCYAEAMGETWDHSKKSAIIAWNTRAETRAQALVAAAYEAAAIIPACQCICKPVTLDKAIRALTPPDAQTALDRLLAEAREEGARAEREEITRLKDGLSAILQYGSDTLTGPSKGGIDTREWQRSGVLEMTNRAARILKGHAWEGKAFRDREHPND